MVSERHETLKEMAMRELQKMGCTDVVPEYTIAYGDKGAIRVDAASPENKIAIEIGSMNRAKEFVLHQIGWSLLHIEYANQNTKQEEVEPNQKTSSFGNRKIIRKDGKAYLELPPELDEVEEFTLCKLREGFYLLTPERESTETT